MNNLEKFYDKKGLYERFEEDTKTYEHFTQIGSSNFSVEIKIKHNISSELTDTQKEYVMNIIKKYVDSKKNDIEKEIINELALDESTAANQVITDLKLRDIVWIKQEVD